MFSTNSFSHKWHEKYYIPQFLQMATLLGAFILIMDHSPHLRPNSGGSRAARLSAGYFLLLSVAHSVPEQSLDF